MEHNKNNAFTILDDNLSSLPRYHKVNEENNSHSKDSIIKQELSSNAYNNITTSDPQTIEIHSPTIVTQTIIEPTEFLISVNKQKLSFIRNLYRYLGFCDGTCKVGFNCKTQKKKTFSMPNDAQRKSAQEWNLFNHNMVYIIADNSNITVIDIDHEEKCPLLTRLCVENCKFCVKTKNGYHFYFKKCSTLSLTLKSGELGFDIPALVFAPPSFYFTDKTRINYSLCITYFKDKVNYREVNENDEISLVDVPRVIIEEIQNMSNIAQVQKQVPNQTTKLKSQTPNTLNLSEKADENTTVDSENKTYTHESLRSLLKIIQNRNKEYSKWRDVGLALHHTNEKLLDTFKEWSKVDYENYDESSVESFLNSIKHIHESDKLLKYASIIQWAKDTDVKAFKKWQFKYGDSDFYYLIKHFTQSDLAEYYYRKHSNSLIYNSDSWYTFDNKTKIWQKLESGDDMLLKIFEFMKCKITKKMRQLNKRLDSIVNEYRNTSNLSLKDKYEECEKNIINLERMLDKVGNTSFNTFSPECPHMGIQRLYRRRRLVPIWDSEKQH